MNAICKYILVHLKILKIYESKIMIYTRWKGTMKFKDQETHGLLEAERDAFERSIKMSVA